MLSRAGLSELASSVPSGKQMPAQGLGKSLICLSSDELNRSERTINQESLLDGE